MTVTKNSALLDPYGGGSSSSAFTTPATVTLAVAATSTDGIVLKTDQTATVGAQKYSPAIHFTGSGWSTSTGTAMSVDYRIEVVPTQGTTTPDAIMYFRKSLNGGAYTDQMQIGNGTLSLPSSFVFNDNGGSKFALATTTGQWSVASATGCYCFNQASNANVPGTFLSNAGLGQGVVVLGTSLGAANGTFRTANLNSSVATGSIGFITGAGGTVTQATSKTTGVTLATPCGAITTHTASIATNTSVSFVMTCTAVAAGDVMILNHISGGTINAYSLNSQCGAGVATISVRNLTAAALGEAITIQYVVIKAVTA